MSGTTAGRLMYNGGKDARLPIDCSVTVAPVSGGTILINVYLAIDGVVDVSTRQGASTSAGNPISITLHWQATYPTGTYTEIFVENTASAVDLLVSSAIHRVN